MPIYETVVIFKPQFSDTEIAALVEKTKKVISTEGGQILNEDRWGRRKLSYPICHSREGYYFYMKYQSPAAIPGRLESQFRIQEHVLRALTVRHEERKPLVKKVKKAKA
mgnify:CR=1 FL=1